MVYPIVLVSLTVLFAVLLHFMAKRRGRNPVLWGVLGACFWFLPIPFLLVPKSPSPDHTADIPAHSKNNR